ncbi:MAG: mannose-6-phosphate isomerase-like protein (cupin superfamily) [Arenicella sp.]|jgi:mannose-6-phosphate isomerase-like protein (cupin superfamily)
MTRKQEYYFKEGCFIEEWHNSDNDNDCSIARVRVEAGKTTKLHALKQTAERYVVLSGSALITVADKCWPLAEGDVVVINPNEPQKIQNHGQKDLIFLAICNPRFLLENYREL